MPPAPPARSAARRAAVPEPLRRGRVPPPPPAPAWRRRALNGLLVFVIVVLVVDALVGDSGLLQRLRVREAYREQQQALDVMRQENQRLRARIRELLDDPNVLEALAREELGLIRPGEVLFIVRDAAPASR